jgi:hypothetical protein
MRSCDADAAKLGRKDLERDNCPRGPPVNPVEQAAIMAVCMAQA